MVLKNSHIYIQAPKTIIISQGTSDEVIMPNGRYNCIRIVGVVNASSFTSGYNVTDFASSIRIRSDKHGELVLGSSRQLFLAGLRYFATAPLGYDITSGPFAGAEAAANTAVPINVPCSVEPDETVTVQITFTSNLGSGVSGTVYIIPEYVDVNKTGPIYIRGKRATSYTNEIPDVIAGCNLIGETIGTYTTGDLTDGLSSLSLWHDKNMIVYVSNVNLLKAIYQSDAQFYVDGVYHITHLPIENSPSTILTASGTGNQIEYVYLYEKTSSVISPSTVGSSSPSGVKPKLHKVLESLPLRK